MERKLLYALSFILVSALVLSGSLYTFARDKSEDVTEDGSKEIAEESVKNSMTYSFDGFDLKYKETLYPEIADKPYLWTFIFEFKSTHEGYGDRTGEEVLEVITPHEAHVTVDEGEVTSAVLDLKWNMIEQGMLGTE